MRAGKIIQALILAALIAVGWCGSAVAANKPDGLALLKQYPDFATITRVSDLSYDGVRIFITLCPYSTAACDRFEITDGNARRLADYVYMFFVFKGYYPSPDPMAGTGEKSRAAGLLQEAQDKGYGKALLDYYAAKTHCTSVDDVVGCVLRRLNREQADDGAGLDYWVQRYVVERHKSGAVSILAVDEDSPMPSSD